MNYLTAVQVSSSVNWSERGSELLALLNRGLGVADTIVRGHVLSGNGGAVLAAPRTTGLLGHLITSFTLDSLRIYTGSVTHETLMVHIISRKP